MSTNRASTEKKNASKNRAAKPRQNSISAPGKTPAIFRAALCTFPVLGSPERNFARIEALSREAAAKGAHLAIFPEGALSGYYGEHFHDADSVDFALIASLNKRLGMLARELRMAIASGTLMRERDGRIFNSMLVFSASGRLAARYDKRHLTLRDTRFYSPGQSGPAIARIEGRRIGFLICFDARFPLWAHEYARRGAEVLVYGFNVCDRRGLWKRPALEAHLRSRAAENQVFLLAVNDGRAHPNVPLLAVDRGGLTLARAFPRRPLLKIVDLDFSRHYPMEREIVEGHALDYECASQWSRSR